MNTFSRTVWRAATAATLLSLLIPATAADSCGGFKWDAAHEVQLYGTAPHPLAAGLNSADAPQIDTEHLYALQLQPQESVHYAVPASKKMLADGAYGGVLRFRVTTAGVYRVAIDAGFWLDVVRDGKALPAADFSGSPGCAGPHKIVAYQLPANSDLLLQISAASTATAKLTVTAVGKPAP